MDDTALQSAVSKGDDPALRSLLATGDSEPVQLNRALMTAVISGRVGAVRSLLEHGADVNHRHPSAETPLFYAVGVGLPMVRLLLDHGADARARTESGMDPLYRYLLDVGPGARLGTGDVEVVKALIDGGLDVREAARRLPWADDFACRFCGRFECRCRPDPSEKELPY